MLQFLEDVVDGWRQARTFRHLLEITAGIPQRAESDISGAKLSPKERLGAIDAADNFVGLYLQRVDGGFAFSVGAIMYDWLSPRYRSNRQGMLAHI